MKEKINLFRDLLRIAGGLSVFALGVHFTIRADIGLSPWDCMSMGVANRTPLNYGLAMTLTSLLILVIDLLLREHVGFGTVTDALITGSITQFFNDHDPFPPTESLWAGALVMTGGMVLMAVGMWIYMSAGRGCGPRDALLVGLGKRLPRVPIGAVEVLLLMAAVAIGALLGARVGPGTLLFMLGFGPVMQAVYHLVGYEPRATRHRSLGEDAAMLLGKPRGKAHALR